MAWRNNIPVSASLLDHHSGIIIDCDDVPQNVSVELYETYASDGYKTDYRARLVRFVKVEAKGSTFTKRYSGRRLDLARKQYDDAIAEFD